jgi:chromosome segregation ATPase
MEVTLSEVLRELRQAEARLELLNKKIQNLESMRQGYLEEIMKGGRCSQEVKNTDEALREKSLILSKTKEQVGKLRGRLEIKLGKFKKELIEEKQKEVNHHMAQRARYLKRIEELEVEASKYRYLVTGEKSHRLANVKDPLPSEVVHQEHFVPIDEIIGRAKLEVSMINRMSSEALLREYLSRERRSDQKR